MPRIPVLLFVLVAILATMGASCTRTVGPTYTAPPPAPMATAYKEAPPDGWKDASPNDGALKGKWWTIFHDQDLDALEDQVAISNQNVLAAEARFRQAKDAIVVARSALYPTVGIGTSATHARTSTSVSPVAGGVRNLLAFPVIDFSYQADFWGSLHRNLDASAENAQAAAAQLENAKLLYQAMLAQSYFALRGIDGDIDLLERTLANYDKSLQLTKIRQEGGVATASDVAQAETQLATAKAQMIDLGVARAQLEHAIAILTGKPPQQVSIARKVLSVAPPPIPVVVPSVLLERRPDIAALERQMAAANEQIGIAQAAFYPSIGLGANAGLQGTSLLNLFSWPSRFWSLGPNASQVLFDAGRRKGNLKAATDAFDVAVANYRQAVLSAFQQVEDNLAALRILEQESAVAAQAVAAAERSLEIANAQYKGGTASYLQVVVAQTAALQNERTVIDLLARRFGASVLLIEAIGGGWDASSGLPALPALKSAAAAEASHR